MIATHAFPPLHASRRHPWALGGALALIALCVQASAFVPPASFILRRMAAKFSGLRGVTATVGGEMEVRGDLVAVQGKLHLAAPDRFRLDLKHDKGEVQETWLGGSKSIRSGGAAQTFATKSHPLVALFLGNARAYLGEAGIDASVISLGRTGTFVCWVIGAKAEDNTKPQLWIDKDTFLPVRVLTFEGEPRRAVEWRMDGYDRAYGAAFPRQLEQRIEDKRVLRIGLVSADTTRVPSESLFTSAAP